MKLEHHAYWQLSAPITEKATSLSGDVQCDVLVIGAGFTGLNSALELAQQGLSVCVLEQGNLGFGASGRNGGFCCHGGTRYDAATLVNRFGLDEAQSIDAFSIRAIKYVRDCLTTWGNTDHIGQDGEIQVAFSAKQAQQLRQEHDDLPAFVQSRFSFIRPDELTEQGLSIAGAYGALHQNIGFGLHPQRYLNALVSAVQSAGGCIYSNTPAMKLDLQGEWVTALTPEGQVQAKRVVIACNGYLPTDLYPAMRGFGLPVISNVAVTEPLDEERLEAQGLNNTALLFDSKLLLHYFRLLPEGRLLFGGRGGSADNERNRARSAIRLKKQMVQYFPALREVDFEYVWGGQLCFNRTGVPFIGSVDDEQRVWSAWGYHGNGVANASFAGKQLAALMQGQAHHIPKAFMESFKPIPFPSSRRWYLRAALLGLSLLDGLGS